MKSFAINTILLCLIILLKMSGCQEGNTPLISEKQLEAKMLLQPSVTERMYGTIPPFEFFNQDSLPVSNKTMAGKLYVAEFFFTTCPSICPKMKTQLLRVYKRFKKNSQVLFLSHTLNPAHDSVALLREYAQLLGVESNKWHMVTGDKEKIFQLAQYSYLIKASEGRPASKGIVHSGAFILVDQQGRVRGLYDGTSVTQVDQLMQDISVLMAPEIVQSGYKSSYLPYKF